MQTQRGANEVYLYGMITPSTVYVLRGDFSFPTANTYAEVEEIHPSVGGEAANSAIVLAKLGLQTKLDGNWLGAASADNVLDSLARFGIDLSRLAVKEQGGTHEIVVVDRASRTVFGNYASFFDGPRQWNPPRAEDVRDAAVVCIDPFFRGESRRAAELCVEHAKPYVTLDCRHDDYLAEHAAAVVISHELRDRAYAGRDFREVFTSYTERCPGLIVFTFGGDETWFGRTGTPLQIHQPYAIDPVDTAGAGDSFRAGVAYGIVQGWDDERIVDFASAVAACVCQTVPHALNAPDLAGVLDFMRRKAARPGRAD